MNIFRRKNSQLDRSLWLKFLGGSIMRTTIAFVSGTIGMLTAFAIFCCGVYAGSLHEESKHKNNSTETE
jgi:hypothetical protein